MIAETIEFEIPVTESEEHWLYADFLRARGLNEAGLSSPQECKSFAEVG